MNEDDDTTGREKRRLTSEDAARILSPDAGWTRPSLTREQEDELLALIRPRLDDASERQFRLFVNRIFAVAVERYVVFSASPRVILRKELETAARRLRDTDLVVEGERSPLIQEVVELVLEDEIPPKVRLDGTISNWVRALPAENWRDLQLRAIERVEVEVKKGPSNVTDRLMVRGLASLVADLTGVVPKRTYRHPNAAGGPVGEVYWFLDLATRLALHVNEALPPDLRRRGVSALTGIVAKELEQLKKQSASSSR